MSDSYDAYVLDTLDDLEKKIAALEKENAKLRVVVEAAEANQQHVATMPWRIDDSQEPQLTCVDRYLFRKWCTGTSTTLDLALRKALAALRQEK